MQELENKLEMAVRMWATLQKDGSVELEVEVDSMGYDFGAKDTWMYEDVKEFVEGGEYMKRAEAVVREFVEMQREQLRQLIEAKRRVEQELQAIASKLGGEVVEVLAEWER